MAPLLLLENDAASFEATGMSDDGQTLVGEVWRDNSEIMHEAARWTEAAGLVGLGFLPGTELEDGRKHSVVRGVSGNGGTIVGYCGNGSFDDMLTSPTQGFIWTSELGMLDLKQYVLDRYDLDNQLAGWKLTFPQDISSDGRSIVGIGVSPSGRREGWLLRLDGATIPEPTTAAIALLALMPLAVWRSRRCVL